QATAADDNAYSRMLREEAEILSETQDWYLFHEHLEDNNCPVYFREFMERAAAKGLQYLGDAARHMHLADVPPETRNLLRQMPADLLQLEQYHDFLRNGPFRRTLLCKSDVALNRAPSYQIVDRFWLSGLVRPVSKQPDVRSTTAEEFRTEAGSS